MDESNSSPQDLLIIFERRGIFFIQLGEGRGGGEGVEDRGSIISPGMLYSRPSDHIRVSAFSPWIEFLSG